MKLGAYGNPADVIVISDQCCPSDISHSPPKNINISVVFVLLCAVCVSSVVSDSL